MSPEHRLVALAAGLLIVAGHVIGYWRGLRHGWSDANRAWRQRLHDEARAARKP